MKIKKLLLLMVFIISLCACTIGCNDFYDTDSNNYNVRYETVTAKVTKLSYYPEHSEYDIIYSQLFKMPMFKTIPEKGYVTIQYHEMKRTFEDIDLYNKYKDKLNQEVEAKLKITSKNGEDIKWQLIVEQ